MELDKLFQLWALLATLGLTAATPIGASKQLDSISSGEFRRNVAKWNEAKALASDVVGLLNRIGQGENDYPAKLTRDDFVQLVERYFGQDSYSAVKSAVFPMFARMQRGLTLGDAGPLKYRYNQGKEGFSGSAYTYQEVISFANQGLHHHPFVDKVHERARVWIHEMAHLHWVNGGNGVRDVPKDSIEYSTEALKKAAKPLSSIYGETLSQYLARCYPNEAPFNNDNVARFAMAVYDTARKGHKPKAAKFKHQCPASQGDEPTFNVQNVPTLSPEIDGNLLPRTWWISSTPTTQATTTPMQAVNEARLMPHILVGPIDASSVTTQKTAMSTQVAVKWGTPHRTLHREGLPTGTTSPEPSPTRCDEERSMRGSPGRSGSPGRPHGTMRLEGTPAEPKSTPTLTQLAQKAIPHRLGSLEDHTRQAVTAPAEPTSSDVK